MEQRRAKSFDNMDLLTEILRRLPSKSLTQFKSVCTSWRSLINSRYFCRLWRDHQSLCRGILLPSIKDHRYVHVSGPTAGVIQFELSRHGNPHVLQSFNGFLLVASFTTGFVNWKFWVLNPATSEVVVLPRMRLNGCKRHARHCNCKFGMPVLGYHGKVYSLKRAKRRRGKPGFSHQVVTCFTENQAEGWTSLGKMVRSKEELFDGTYWRNYIVWVNKQMTLFYDVKGDAMRRCASPSGYVIYRIYWIGVSGGNLYFINVHKGSSSLMINEMKHDLSGWFVKHSIGLRQIESSLFRSIGWITDHMNFKVVCLIEESNSTLLVVGCKNDVVLYRIQDHKSWKLCEWELFENGPNLIPRQYFHLRVFHHIPTISKFQLLHDHD